MAIDQTLLERAEQLGERWLRLYRWRPFCLSFGRHEPATRRYDPFRIAALGIDTVRRPTGGRAVWHAQELTYAVAAPAAEFGFLRAAYLEIHCMLAQALGRIGVPAYLAPQAAIPTLDAGACFTQAVGGEIMCSGRKLVGSAQLRMGNALLQHGSILLHDEQEVVRDVTTGAPPTRRAPSNRAPWARASDIAEAIAAQAQRRWSGSWKRITDHSAILSGAAAHHSRFQSSSWTWKR
jgi:lipoate-protein ligase A